MDKIFKKIDVINEDGNGGVFDQTASGFEADIIKDFKKLSGINEDFSIGDKVLYRDKYMNKSLSGKVTKLLDSARYGIEITLTSGSKDNTTASKNDLTLVKPKVKPEVKSEDDVVGKTVKILPGSKPEKWDKYIGEYGRVEDTYENTFIVSVLTGDEPTFYIPKQYLRIED